MSFYKSLRNIKLHGAVEHSNENEHTNKVSILDVVTQNKCHLADEVQEMKTRMRKLEEDITNRLQKLEDLLITTNNKV